MKVCVAGSNELNVCVAGSNDKTASSVRAAITHWVQRWPWTIHASTFSDLRSSESRSFFWLQAATLQKEEECTLNQELNDSFWPVWLSFNKCDWRKGTRSNQSTQPFAEQKGNAADKATLKVGGRHGATSTCLFSQHSIISNIRMVYITASGDWLNRNCLPCNRASRVLDVTGGVYKYIHEI